MVQEPDTLSQANRQDSLDDGLPPLEIDDSTPPEVLNTEDEFFGAPPSVQDVEETGTGTPVDESGTADTPPETDTNGTTSSPVEEVVIEEPQAEVPQQRTYTQEEWAKRQSAYDRQMAEQAARLKEIEAAQQKQAVENQIEAELRRQETSLAPTVGTEEAQRLARDPNNVNAVREALQARSELETVRQERNQYATQSKMAVMNNWLGTLKQAHGLDDADVQSLQTLVNDTVINDDAAFVQTGEAMGLLAQRLAATAGKRAVASSERKNLVPRETSETALESGQSISHAPPNEDSEAAAIMDKPSWEWTDADADLIRRRSRV